MMELLLGRIYSGDLQVLGFDLLPASALFRTTISGMIDVRYSVH